MTNMAEFESRENLSRVNSLIESFNALEANNLGDPLHRKDILRACVVFLHSTIEELVRNLFISKLPDSSISVLNELPYSGYGPTNRTKGILLGDLLHNHRGNFVDNVILESINAYVDVLNINNTGHLCTQLEKINIDLAPCRELFPDLNSLMKRRHQIVHQMDRENSLDPNTHPVANIDLAEVRVWHGATESFIDCVLAQVT